MPLGAETRTGHAWAYASLGAGAALVGGSFLFSDRADDAYDAYLAETDRGRIEHLYDRTVLFDRLATGSLLAGEALLAFGLYLRFLKPPLPQRVGLAVEPGRCAVSCRF